MNLNSSINEMMDSNFIKCRSKYLPIYVSVIYYRLTSGFWIHEYDYEPQKAGVSDWKLFVMLEGF